MRANVICRRFVRTPLVEKQIPEQAKELGISKAEVAKNVLPKDTVDGRFTTVRDVAEAAIPLSLRGVTLGEGPLWSRIKLRRARRRLGSTSAPEPSKPLRMSMEPNLCGEILLPHPYNLRAIGQVGNGPCS